MADPHEIVANLGIAAKYHRLDVPFNFSCKPIVPFKVYCGGGHLVVLIANEKILPPAQPDPQGEVLRT
jgi:hypothetical protein